MSKVEVKVKRGDKWATSSGMLFQFRGDKDQLVVNDEGRVYGTQDQDWEDREFDREPVPDDIARAWIEKRGGTVVEEREEEVPAKVVAHLDVTASEDNGEVHLSVEGSQSCKWRDREPDLYRRITIAGVTT